MLCLGCTNSGHRIDKSKWEGVLTSDAEQSEAHVTRTSNSSIHTTGNFYVENQFARSGTHCLRVDKSMNQAFMLEITGVSFLDQITAKVWRKRSGFPSQLSIRSGDHQYNYAAPSGNIEGDWEELVIVYNSLIESDSDTVMIQCKFDGEAADTSWFDDFSCEIVSYDSDVPQAKEYGTATLSLSLPKASYTSILQKRRNALKVGILQKGSDDEVPALLNTTMNCEVRLKGDWTDHLSGSKWSFRVKMKDGHKWNGTDEFSIQSPVTRNMLNEWIYHELLMQEGVLTTSYNFSPFELNDRNIGVMAIEGHFTDDLLENQGRPLGPILKMNEDPVWQARAEADPMRHSYPFQESALISCFSRKKFQGDPVLNEILENGRALFLAHQKNLAPLDSLIDVDKLARYYAISEIMGAGHGMVWHNLRFYYNPQLDRLEPVAFDGNPTIRPEATDLNFFNMINQDHNRQPRRVNIFSSVAFRKAFANYLKAYSDEAFVSEFLTKKQTDIDSLQVLLRKDYPNYEFPASALKLRCQGIAKMIESFELEEMTVEQLQYKDQPKHLAPRPYASVGAYRDKMGEDFYSLEILSFFHDTLIAYKIEDKHGQAKSINEKLQPFSKPEDFSYTSLTSDLKIDKVYLRTISGEHEVVIEPYKFPYPDIRRVLGRY